MSWKSRVSFVLTEAMSLKRLKLLDVALEASASNNATDSGFHADAALITGELSGLIPDLVQALGGELVRELPVAAA